jgi:hypothetical protein
MAKIDYESRSDPDSDTNEAIDRHVLPRTLDAHDVLSRHPDPLAEVLLRDVRPTARSAKALGDGAQLSAGGLADLHGSSGPAEVEPDYEAYMLPNGNCTIGILS